jgi:hypothetical protein
MAVDITALYYCLDDFCELFEAWQAHRLIPSQRTRQRPGKLLRSEMLFIVGVRRLMEINYVTPNWRRPARLPGSPDQPGRIGQDRSVAAGSFRGRTDRPVDRGCVAASECHGTAPNGVAASRETADTTIPSPPPTVGTGAAPGRHPAPSRRAPAKP